MNTKEILEKIVRTGEEQLEEMEPGTEKYKTQVDCITKCAEQVTKIDKFEVDCENLDVELAFKKKQAKKENIDRWVKNGLTAVNVIGGFALIVWGTKGSWKFEENGGVMTNDPGKGFMRGILNKIK